MFKLDALNEEGLILLIESYSLYIQNHLEEIKNGFVPHIIDEYLNDEFMEFMG